MNGQRGTGADSPNWGEVFRARRELIGLAQNDIAQITGLTRQAISRFENGEVEPRLDTLERYARSVGATVADLFPVGSKPVERDTWGARFRCRREQKGLRQIDVAEATGRTQQAVSRLEHDQVVPRRHTLMRYAEVLDSDVDELFPAELRPSKSEAAKQAERYRADRHRNGGK